MSAHPLEKTYEPHEWRRLGDLEYQLDFQNSLLELRPWQLFRICNCDSEAAQELYKRNKLPDILIDYELLAMDENTLSGTKWWVLPDGRYVVGVYQSDSSVHYYIEKV